LKIGYKAVVILKIRIDSAKIEDVTRDLSRLKAVWFIVHTTGEPDVYAEFVTESMESLNELLHKEIYKIDGITSVETSLILNYVKRNYNWGVAQQINE
jgi:Lrp/AsnC family transcriptional regulator for asnA, asnC and gidA